MSKMKRSSAAIAGLMPGRSLRLLIVALGLVSAGGKAAEIQGTGSISGTVEARKPFKAAQVYIRNVEKRILYMVYTNGGRFRAVNLFPGSYEINVEVKGMESGVRNFVVKAGDHRTLKLSLRDSVKPGFRPSAVPDSGAGEKFAFQSYDEIYPPGPGKQIVEQVCMTCHSENHFPLKPRSEEALRNGFAEKCMGKNLWERDKTELGEGAMAPPVTRYRFGAQDRKEALDYLARNFGADAKPRAVQVPPSEQLPLDEAQLGKAMYMEYYLTVDPSGQGINAPQYQALKQPFVGMRQGTVVQLDTDGNVWMIDRGVPNRLVKLDPRTGIQKDFLMPEPTAGAHDLLIDRDGIIWAPEFTFVASTRTPHLLGFNPKSEQWQYNLVADPDDEIRNSFKAGGFALAVDSKGNLYMTWLTNDALGKRDRQTGKITTYLVPTNGAGPYGNAVDQNDNVWIAEARTSKIAKFDTQTGQWTEFTPLTHPAYLRRGPGVDASNNVWFVLYAAGNRPGKLARIDQSTGRITEWAVPHRGAQPYEASPDVEGNIWFPDQPLSESNASQSLPATIARFDPRDATFTFYPKPQFVADSSKLVHTTEGALWYSPRADKNVASQAAGFGVLYPDMDKMTTFAAHPQNGPPGYAFKTPAGGAPVGTP
jgi:virginiamycin B lyase